MQNLDNCWLIMNNGISAGQVHLSYCWNKGSIHEYTLKFYLL